MPAQTSRVEETSGLYAYLKCVQAGGFEHAEIKLLQHFANTLHLGQWELSRALLLRLKDKDEGLARAILRVLVKQPDVADWWVEGKARYYSLRYRMLMLI